MTRAPTFDVPRATFQRKFPDHGTAAEVDALGYQGFSLLVVKVFGVRIY